MVALGLFIDGVLNDTINWGYPKADVATKSGTYTVGNSSEEAQMSWCLASSYLLSVPLGAIASFPFLPYIINGIINKADDLPRLIHHLGPRYCGIFQDPYLVKFLTYEASTSLNMFLATLAMKMTSSADRSPLVKAVKDGLGINESSIIFAISPSNVRDQARGALKQISLPSTPSSAFFLSQTQRPVRNGIEQKGDIFPVFASCLDSAMWKVGGAAVALRLVQIANVGVDCSFYSSPILKIV